MLGIAAGLILPALFGFIVLSFPLRGCQDRGIIERSCMAFPLGTGLLTLLLFFMGLLRIPLTLGITGGVLLFITVFLLALSLRAKISLLARQAIASSPPHRPLASIAGALLTAWISVKLVSVFVETYLRPIYAWDSWANWSVGPKLFLQAKSLLLDAPGSDFFGGGALHRFLSYPIHNHLMQLWLGLWAGGFDEILVKMSTPVYFSCAVGILAVSAGRVTGSKTIGLILAVFLASSPLAAYHAIEVYSDLPLGLFFLLATVSASEALNGRNQYWPLAGVFSAIALFVKEEAPFFILPLALSLIAAIIMSPESRTVRLRTARSFLVPFLLMLPWYVFKMFHGLGIGAASFELTFQPSNLITVIGEVASIKNFNIVFLFFPFLALAAGRPSRTFLHLVAPLVCYALFFLLLYTCTVYYDRFFRNGTVFFRNMLTIYPTVLFLTAHIIRRIRERTGRMPPSKAF